MLQTFPISDTRAIWARRRSHDGIMRGKRLALPAGVATRYADVLQSYTDHMTATIGAEIRKLFEHSDVKAWFATDISPSAQARILTNKLKRDFESLFAGMALGEASEMVDQVNAASTAAVGSSLTELSGGLKLKTDVVTGPMKEFMTGTIAENVSLIKSIPSQYFRKIQGAVLRSITTGNGLADLEPFLEEQTGVESRRAKNIAIDQTHKAYAGLNKGRMQNAGIQEYEWVHSGGGLHPRPYHLDVLDGQHFRIDTPPIIDQDTGERGIPGQLINCRCTMVPVIRFDQGEQADDDDG
jgi:SPP1 gp7 family putative phage head morphogenesis protein